ncbi:E3 ubiquitin-protein ligase RNF126-B [Fopius arisanus]|uniref:RING-type E3 ubiquitin transferase n=1 Tax=Fopius arisanus TaxID=64838 RepID=A0A9R1U8I1_9HYME|nr:PREDICTED: E3 ubiquitin-protein ligase RNF126-B [Fopius arisanus]
MAEAVVDGSPMSRFFCHKCSIEIQRLLPDYTCPHCASGFIEKLENEEDDQDMNMEISAEDFNDIDFDQQMYMELSDIPELTISGSEGDTGVSRSRRRSDLQNRLSNARQRRRMFSYENLFHEFFINLSGLGRPVTTGQPPVFFLGNPGDYVWGRDGLDSIVTQLLNQMDGSGPPPLPRQQIDEIPNTIINQSQIDCKLQCSICWEDFILAESVRQLPCKHLYHTPCIVPWLELHGTCPICRQSLGEQSSAEANQDEVGPSLAALFRAVQSSNQFTSRASSTSSSTSSNYSNDSSNEH